jgi:hypothetical protein
MYDLDFTDGWEWLNTSVDTRLVQNIETCDIKTERIKLVKSIKEGNKIIHQAKQKLKSIGNNESEEIVNSITRTINLSIRANNIKKAQIWWIDLYQDLKKI